MAVSPQRSVVERNGRRGPQKGVHQNLLFGAEQLLFYDFFHFGASLRLYEAQQGQDGQELGGEHLPQVLTPPMLLLGCSGCPMPNLAALGPMVWPAIGNKQTNKQTDRRTLHFIYIDPVHAKGFGPSRLACAKI